MEYFSNSIGINRDLHIIDYGRQPSSAVVLHSSNEPGELLQRLCHDNSTIDMAVTTTG